MGSSRTVRSDRIASTRTLTYVYSVVVQEVRTTRSAKLSPLHTLWTNFSGEGSLQLFSESVKLVTMRLP